jgi:type I restriction enzyme S subunit
MCEKETAEDSAWNYLPLSEVFRIACEATFPAKMPMVEFIHYSIPAWDDREGPVTELGAQIESNKNAICVPSVLVSKLNPRKPRVAVVENPSQRTCSSTEFICYQPKQKEDCLRFWGAYFSSNEFSGRLARIAVGSTNSHTRASPRETLSWLVPEIRFEEKQSIAQIFDTLNISIHETEAIIAKLEAVRKGLLHDLLTRGIGADGELRPPQSEAPHLYKKSPLSWIPHEWELISLGAIVRRSKGILQTGPFGSQLHAHEYVADGIPVIMPQDMVGGFLSEAKIARINSNKVNSLARHRVQLNDLVFSRRGDLSLCVAILEKNRGWLCGTGCLLARFSKKEIDGKWLALVYQQPFVQVQVNGRAVGSTMANMNTSILGSLVIGRPTLQEQKEVTRRVSCLKQRISLENDVLQKLWKQKSGLMDDLLTGRVRVTPLLKKKKRTA